MLDSVKYAKIIDKMVLSSCLKCGDTKRSFSIGGESNYQLNDFFLNIGPSIPVILVFCNNCGHIDSYAKLILDARE